jgi:hypothetical protein
MLEQFPNQRFPFTWAQVWTAAWVLFLSGWGGAVSFWRKRREGTARPFNLTELVGEIFTSGFAGVLTYLLATAAHINPLIIAALVGISGHLGSRAIFGIEKMLEHKFPMYGGDEK